MIIGYVLYDEAISFLKDRFDLNLSDEDIKKALWRAYDKIEEIDVRYAGKDSKFPRTIDNGVVPNDIKKAQILEAYSIATNPRQDINTENIVSKSIGRFSVTYNKTNVGKVEFLNKNSYDIINSYRRKTY